MIGDFLPHVPKLATSIIASCMCLVALHLLRGRRAEATRTRSTRTFRLVLAIVAGFILTVFLTDGTLKFIDAQRIHTASLLVTNAVNRTDPARNQIVLVGSSQTSQGINDVMLEQLLDQSGLNIQVIQLAVAGLFNVESDVLLEQYLARTPHLPTAIFIDTGFDSEHVPVVGLRRGALEISASSWPHTWQRIKLSWLRYSENIKTAGIRHPAATLSHAASFSWDVIDSLDFFLCNATNCGILRQLDPALPGQYSIGTDLHFGHAKDFTPNMVLAPTELTCRVENREMTAEFMEPSLNLRRSQAEKYTKLGIVVGFYYPPNLTTRTACFQTEFCARIGAYPCLTLDNLPLLTALNSFENWYDPHHVTNFGVPIFTEVLARDIEKLFTSGKVPIKAR